MTPAEREVRQALSLRFAIEAADEAEARAILGQALARCDRDLPLQASRRLPDIWLRSPEDDILLHPAVQAVMILCEQSEA